MYLVWTMRAGVATYLVEIFEVLSKSELTTTDTELSAMAAPASSGLRVTPAQAKIPAAIGIPRTL
jgi:hypothetical protein